MQHTVKTLFLIDITFVFVNANQLKKLKNRNKATDVNYHFKQ